VVSIARGESSSATAPVIQIGDTWKYRVLDGFTGDESNQISFRIVELSDNEISTQVTWAKEQKRSLYIFDRQWNRLDDGNGRWEPFQPYFKFPLVVGSEWTQAYRYSAYQTGSSFSNFAKLKVVKVETVTVPAGTFHAFRVDIEGEARSAGTDGTVTKDFFTVWYAPEANRFVRTQSQRIANGRVRGKGAMELMEYFPGKTEAKSGAQ
jgi:uncharacterized protein YbaA (DUF1428 family)